MNKSLLLLSKQGTFGLQDVDIPEPRSGEVLVKIEAVALNPVDWKVAVHGIIVETYPAVLGSDIAGTIVALGPGTRGVQVGERVCVHRSLAYSQKCSTSCSVFQNPFENKYGGFQQYALADPELISKVSLSIPNL